MNRIQSIIHRFKPSPRLYRSCDTLPLSRFRICLHGDLSALMMDGSMKPSLLELEQLWDSIFMEYVDLVRDPEQMYSLNLMRDIAVLESDLNLSASLVIFLSMKYDPEAEKSLKNMGFKFNLKPDDRQYNSGQLDKVIRQRKAKALTLNQKRKLLEEHQNKAKKGPKENPGDFDKVIAELSAFQGYRLDPGIISVAEYAAIHARFKKHVEQSQKSKWKK